MYGGDRDSQTICAVSTPHGVGGISVIRISGPGSLKIVRFLAPNLPLQVESHRAYFGTLSDPGSNEEVDEVLTTYFQEGRSFTGEEVVEISCHGNPQICQRILNLLIAHGAVSADRGEFTYRAFMNGRMDLVQAESILSLIESESEKATKLALRQLKGQLSEKLEILEDDLTWLMAHLEAGIDFSTEDLDLLHDEAVSKRLLKIELELRVLVGSYRSGRIIKDGIRIALAGRPNVGKSSLLNLLLEEDRAIVTEIPGTTRDVISGDTHYAGLKLTFLDTAGIRHQATDIVEQIGIQKSHAAHLEADVILFVYDAFDGLLMPDLEVLGTLKKDHLFIVGNKIDKLELDPRREDLLKALGRVEGLENLTQLDEFAKRNLFFVSALDQNARPLILNEIVAQFSQTALQESILLSSARHFENLSKALSNTSRCLQLLKEGLGSEFLAFELKEALIAVQETLGKRFDDQVMDRVFKEFCLGK